MKAIVTIIVLSITTNLSAHHSDIHDYGVSRSNIANNG